MRLTHCAHSCRSRRSRARIPCLPRIRRRSPCTGQQQVVDVSRCYTICAHCCQPPTFRSHPCRRSRHHTGRHPGHLRPCSGPSGGHLQAGNSNTCSCCRPAHRHPGWQGRIHAGMLSSDWRPQRPCRELRVQSVGHPPGGIWLSGMASLTLICRQATTHAC